MEDLDPNDPNYKHHKIVRKIQAAYNTLPSGWRKNPNVGTKTGEAPYVHDDGRTSWKNPNSDQIKAMLDVAMKEEEKELEHVVDSSHHSSNNSNNAVEMKEDSTSSNSTAPNQRLLKKYRLMFKRGVPLQAVKQSAHIVDRLDLEDVDILGDPNQVSSSESRNEGDVPVVKTINRPNTKENKLSSTSTGTQNTTSSRQNNFQERQNNALIKKYKRMMKAGVPIEGIKTAARREICTADVDFLEPILTSTIQDESKSNEAIDSPSEQFFKPLPDSDRVEFNLNNVNMQGASLGRLIQKMILTVNKGRVGMRNASSRESILTASVNDLYNALGALRGVQVARDMFNVTCAEKVRKMHESEIKAKRKPFLELIGNLGVSSPTHAQEEVDIKGLDELIQYIELKFEKELKEIHDMIDVGMYDFNSLTEIYKPGSRVVAKSVFASGVDMICEVSWNRLIQGIHVTYEKS